MGLRDRFEDIVAQFRPKPSRHLGGGIGSGHGMVGDDDMIVSKPVIVVRVAQIFFNFLALCCYASLAAFQAKWDIGPSGLSGFAIFVAVFGILLSSFMLLVPVAYEKYNKLIRLAHAVREVRVGFIMTGAGFTFSLLIAFVVTISAWTQPGCKDPKTDPSAEANGDDFKKALPGWCVTKKAAAAFFWFAFLFWAASLAMLILDWRSGKLFAHHQRDTPFQPPTRDEEEAEEEEEEYAAVPPPRQTRPASPGYDTPNTGGGYTQPNPQHRRYSGAPTSTQQTPLSYTGPAVTGRQSMDAYGAFSDPAPSGFGSSGYNGNHSNSGYSSPSHNNRISVPPTIPEPDFGQPMVSRTMQYADPYAAVRASIGVGGSASPQQGQPPSYESYTGYRS